jgi:hypothetical protein
MRVRELLDILRDQSPDLEVELALVAPVEDDESTITVDRFPVDGVLPWLDEDTGEEVLWLIGGDEDTGEEVLWLIGGDEDDVDAFLDAIEEDGGDHEGHDHPN